MNTHIAQGCDFPGQWPYEIRPVSREQSRRSCAQAFGKWLCIPRSCSYSQGFTSTEWHQTNWSLGLFGNYHSKKCLCRKTGTNFAICLKSLSWCSKISSYSMAHWVIRQSRVERTVTPRRLSENREPTAEKPFWPDFPIKFVKYAQYSPHLIKKSGSKWLSLATAPILGQPPGR